MRTIAATLSVLALAGCMTASPARLPAKARYVAMGSSFAAGAGIAPLKQAAPVRCGRSEASYATLLAKRLDLALEDVTCGGATTAHILGPWSELPPQIDAVTPETRLVTITIGGNDLGHVMNLMAASCPPEGWTHQGRTMPCPPTRIPQAADYARLEGQLRAIVQAVRVRAPQARVVFVQYVRMVPDAPCPALRLSGEGAMASRVTGEQLARVTARAAAAEGAQVLAADELSRAHTPCDAEPWSAGPVPLGPQAPTPWHPNAAGHAAIADALAEMLGG